MATFCLVADAGGPVLVLASADRGARLQAAVPADAPYVASAPQYLVRARRRAFRHGASCVHAPAAFAFGVNCWHCFLTSIVVALIGLLVPVEVIFDLPGLGQLAWSAALNRDLPVLLAVTLMVAACVAVAGSSVADSRTRTARLLEADVVRAAGGTARCTQFLPLRAGHSALAQRLRC